MKHKTPYLMIEQPTNTACVDFLSDNVCVELTVSDGKLRIVVKVSNDQSSYIWKQEEFEVDCE